MNIHFIKTPEKREIIAQLNKQYGITELPYLLIETGKEKIRGFSGSLSKDEIQNLGQLARIELIGSYLIRKEHDMRLSFDALHLLKNQIVSGIIEINEEEYEEWIRGYDLNKRAEKGTFAVRFKGDFVGCGKSTGDKLINHVPKERRLKSKLPEKEE